MNSCRSSRASCWPASRACATRRRRCSSAHGDRLFLYTDGVTEAINAASELYGEDRLKAALNKGAALQPEELLAAVKTSMNEFTAGAEQFDDITMLALEVR